MKKRDLKAVFARYADFSVPVIVGVLAVAAAIFGLFTNVEYRLYDFLLGKGRDIKEDQNIMLVDVDDISVDDVGVWPWGRDIVADILLRMKEFGAFNVVFDIEYLQKSGESIPPEAQRIMASAIETARVDISGLVSQFAAAASSGMYSPAELEGLSSSLMTDYIEPSLDGIETASSSMARDNDAYFAQALQFFGNTYLTINTGMQNELDSMEKIEASASMNSEYRIVMDSRNVAVQRFLYSHIVDPLGLVEKGNVLEQDEQLSYRGFYPARNLFLRSAVGAGFTNVIVDRDGTRRRIELLHHLDPNKKFLWKKEGDAYVPYQVPDNLYVGQLAFSPLLSYLDVKSVERKFASIVLHDALLPGHAERKDIRIPLDSKGAMLINWIKSDYISSFRKHVSAAAVYELDKSEERIIQNLSNITKYRITDADGYDMAYFTEAGDILADYETIRQMRDYMLSLCKGYDENGNAIDGGIAPSMYDDYFAARRAFYERMSQYIDGDYGKQAREAFESIGESAIAEEVLSFFKGLSIDKETFYSYYDSLSEQFKNSFCFIGNTATSSTDLGVTPFVRRYANLGTHANVVNTIVQEDFVTPLPWWCGLAFSFFCVILILTFTHSKGNAAKNFYGLLYVLVPTAVIAALMILFKIYVEIFVPVLFLLFTYILELAVNFVAVSRERNTLSRGFSAYVAPEVVKQIVKDPSRLGLGGANKHITALFSDVKTFSGFTELINNEEGESNGAVRLVAILNEYLGALSDAIMDNKGTIDKYVGDEIVSFFGAPIDDPLNAYNACVAGIRMKQAEEIYNKEHFDNRHDIPMRLQSRVGINTGDMVVGNMGTEQKLNYTVMGNNVNLASRLEGTNKAYSSWIMCSESTWKAADAGETKGLLVARNFDCVQVINVKKPVQIYNILGLRSELSPAQIEAADIFNEGMKWYLKGSENPEEKKDIEDLRKALEFFKQADLCYEADESSRVFIERCEDFLINGLPDVWDGVYVMKSK